MNGLSTGKGRVRAIVSLAVMCAVVVVSLVMGPTKAFSLNVGDITTIAGNGIGGYSGDGGPATSAMISAKIGGGPYVGVAIDRLGNLFIADYYNNRVRKVDSNGTITTVAGNGTAGYSGDGGPATAAMLYHPMSVTFDSSGNLFIVDEYNHRIRKVDSSGRITTVAGTGSAGFSGDGGAATAAKLYYPNGIVFDSAGNLFISDGYNYRIRKVNTSGIISTAAGNGTAGFSGDGGQATGAQLNALGMTFDNAGNLFFADYSNHRIRKINTSGIISTVAGNGTAGFSGDGGLGTTAMLYNPFDIVVDSSGNLFFSDWGNNRIRKVAANGIITTVAGTGTAGFSGDGGPATGANVYWPTGVTLDNSGNLIFGDAANSRIRKVIGIAAVNTCSGINNNTITTVAGNGIGGFSGDGGLATSASISAKIGGGPYIGVAVDRSGNMFIADYYNHRIRKVDSNGTISTVAGNGTAGFSGDGGSATGAMLNHPMGVAFDSSGNMFIVDEYNHRIRKVDTNGIISTVVGSGMAGFSGDGGSATDAKLYYPSKMVFDKAGNIFITDSWNYRIRKVDTNGKITTFAGTGSGGFSGDGGPASGATMNPLGLAFDGNDNLLVADYGNHRIRKVDTNGNISTIAGNGTAGFSGDGGLATTAMISSPFDVAVDSGGNLFFTDWDSSRIRKIDTSGKITTVAGTGTAGFSGDNGPATAANIYWPTGVTIDNAGNLIFGDAANSRIRKVITNCPVTTYTVSTSVTGGNGSITPANSTVNSGSAANFTLAPAAGYQPASTVGGTCPSGSFSGNTYTTGAITADCSVNFSFVPTSVTITTTTSGNGTITCIPGTTVAYGTSVSCTATAAAGNHISLVAVDGAGQTITGPTTFTYSFGNVTANHTMNAIFAIDTYNVTASVIGGNGSITPASSTVNSGGSATLTIVPALCYNLATLTDNGSNVLGNVSNGSYTLTNIITNHAVSGSFAADAVPPVFAISTLPDGSYTNNNVLNISGTVTDNCGFKELTINGAVVPVNPDGTFSHALVLQAGPNLITTTATDLVGNQITDTRTITLDQTAPKLVIITPADNSKTANPLATVSGTVDETATVTVELINSLGSTSQTAAMNGINFTTDLTLAPGTNTILVTATDLAGNTSSGKRTVIYDDQAPSLSITVPAQDISTNQATLIIRGTASDLYTGVTIRIDMDGQTYTPALINGQFEQAVTFTTEKSYAIIVTATNEAGTSTTAQRNVIYDTTPPAFGIDPVTSPTTQPTQTISGTREANIPVTVACATATVGPVEYPTATTWRAQLSGLTLGNNVITAIGTDDAGNPATATATIKLVTSGGYLETLIKDLVSSGALPAKTADTLLDTLAKALAAYSSNPNLGDNMMNTFKNQVNAAQSSNKISAATAQLLIDAANSVIANQGK